MDDLNIALTEEGMKEVKRRFLQRLEDYRKTISYASCDVPIGVLCLPSTIETLLINNGCLRVYDLLNRDLTEIKGLGVNRLRELNARLDQFLVMS